MNLTDELVDRAFTGDWRGQAACHQVPANEAEWFPGIHQARDPRVRRAKEICAICPVREECLVWGLFRVTGREGGIYGGLTVRGRLRLKAQLQAEGHAVAIRICAMCDDRFYAKLHSPYDKVKCPDCRKEAARVLDRRQGRSGTLSRAKLRLRRGEELTPAQQAAVDSMA